MFKKKIEPKTRGAMASAIVSLLGGAISYIVSSGEAVPYPWALQVVSVALFAYSIYIATAHLFKRHTVVIEPTADDAKGGEEVFDLIIYEAAGKRERKVCHVAVGCIDFVRVVDVQNKKEVARDRREKDRYTYDAQFAAERRLEIAITSGGEVASILLTYDQDVLNALLLAGVKKL